MLSPRQVKKKEPQAHGAWLSSSLLRKETSLKKLVGRAQTIVILGEISFFVRYNLLSPHTPKKPEL
jgi:hypothetical protein